MATALTSFLLGPYVDAHDGVNDIDYETFLKYFTFYESPAIYIQNELKDNNLLATTKLKTNKKKLEPYVGKTLFEIYIIAACRSTRYIFDKD